MKPPAGSFWQVVGVFGILGPFIGGVFVGILVIVEKLARNLPLEPGDLAFVLFAGVAGFLGGGIPAVATGAACASVSRRIASKVVWVVLAGALGGAFTWLANAHAPEAWSLLGPVGAASALICGTIALQVRPRWNN